MDILSNVTGLYYDDKKNGKYKVIKNKKAIVYSVAVIFLTSYSGDSFTLTDEDASIVAQHRMQWNQ